MNRNEPLPNTEIDTEIEREIQELLAVDPSREFLPAMRRRIANEPAPSEWRFGQTLMLAGAITAAVVVAGVVFSRSASTSVDQQRQSVGAVSSALPAPAPAAVTQEPTVVSTLAVTASRATARRQQRGPGIAVNRGAEPEVLVSPGEAAALRQFLANVRAGRVDLTAAELPTTTEEVSELTGIHPLVPVTIQEGVLQ